MSLFEQFMAEREPLYAYIPEGPIVRKPLAEILRNDFENIRATGKNNDTSEIKRKPQGLGLEDIPLTPTLKKFLNNSRLSNRIEKIGDLIIERERTENIRSPFTYSEQIPYGFTGRETGVIITPRGNEFFSSPVIFSDNNNTITERGRRRISITLVPGLTAKEKATLAQRRRVAKLRNPHIQSLLRFVRATPHLWDQIQGFQKRRDLLERGTKIAGENHRQFTPLLAGMAVNAESRAYLQISLDEAAKQESDALKTEAEANKGYYTPLLVVGAGIHGSIFNAELIANRPDAEVLTIDQSERLGGKFRKPGGPVIGTNSRDRAEDRALPNLPGTPGNINSMGEHAPMQVPDVSGEVYADNDSFGLVAALNQYLSGNTMLGVRMIDAKRNNTAGKGQITVTLEDTKSGKRLTVDTDQIIYGSGRFDRKFGLDMTDPETAEILAEDFEATIQAGEIPQVIPYDILLQIAGNRENQFPLEKFIGKRIAVVGGKDSGNTTVEILIGLGPESRGSVAQMGRPANIVWYGPKFRTQDEYRKITRFRYAQLGSSLPRVAGDAAPVQPVAERVTKLRRTADKKITVLSNDADLKEREEDFDYVVLATGAEDVRAQIFKDLISAYSDPDNFNDSLFDVFGTDRQGNRVVIARGMFNAPVTFIGPDANIPISEAERAQISGLVIPENSVAIWRYVDKTVATARQVGPRLPRGIAKNSTVRPVPVTETELLDAPRFTIPQRQEERMFPPEVNYADLLRIQTMAFGSPIAEGADNLTFIVQRTASEDPALHAFSATILEGSEAGTQRWVSRFIGDGLNQRLLAKLARASGTVTIQIPVSDRKVPVEDIQISTRAKKRK